MLIGVTAGEIRTRRQVSQGLEYDASMFYGSCSGRWQELSYTNSFGCSKKKGADAKE